jgi:uncharacterized protein
MLCCLAVLIGFGIFQAGPERWELRAGSKTYRVRMVRTQAAQTKGLSGEVALPHDEGMLFAYGDSAIRCFWMKDMRFPIDIIWADAQRRVVHIETSVTPESYPRTFCPDMLAQYVLELRAGEANHANITTGSKLSF